MIKIDTEGYDVVILEDLDPKLRPSVMWIEWFTIYQFYKYDRKTQNYIYEVFNFKILLQLVSCSSINYYYSVRNKVLNTTFSTIQYQIIRETFSNQFNIK